MSLPLKTKIQSIIKKTKNTKISQGNKKSKNPLNEREIVDKAFEFLQKESAYINEGDGTKISRNQAQMLIDLQLIKNPKIVGAKLWQNNLHVYLRLFTFEKNLLLY